MFDKINVTFNKDKRNKRIKPLNFLYQVNILCQRELFRGVPVKINLIKLFLSQENLSQLY